MNLRIFVKNRKLATALPAFGFVLINIVGCGTPYQDQSALIKQRQNAREKAIEQYVRSDLKIGERYLEYGFSNEEVIKPESFRRLDSLYAAMNTESRKSIPNASTQKWLKREIELEKSKVMADTVHFLFKKEHFFGISKNDSITFMNGSFYVNPKNEISKVRLNYVFELGAQYHVFYQAYINKTSFLEPGMEPYFDEFEFYDRYDAIFNTLPENLQGNFLSHTLQIMRAAFQQQSLEAEPLIKQHIINTITGNAQDYKQMRWSSLYFRANEQQVIEEYEVDHEWMYTDKFNIQHEMRKTFILNPYFEIISFYDAEKVRP